MTTAKELLDAATPLPWRARQDRRRGAPVIQGPKPDEGFTEVVADVYSHHPGNAALIVYAVNRLPDYEAAVEALDRLMELCLIDEEDRSIADQDQWAIVLNQAGAALARLRDEVKA